jgi:hypothetical protein
MKDDLESEERRFDREFEQDTLEEEEGDRDPMLDLEEDEEDLRDERKNLKGKSRDIFTVWQPQSRPSRKQMLLIMGLLSFVMTAFIILSRYISSVAPTV